jgi:hypothetical protein
LLAASVLGLGVQAALGAAPVHEKTVINLTLRGEVICGVPVTTRVLVRDNVLAFEDRAYFLSQERFTWTNAEGDWLQDFIAGRVMITDELDGDLLTSTVRYSGVHQRLRSSHGITAAFERGQIAFRTVIDLNDLEDPFDDELISFETLFQAGPHPVAESGFALFCDVFVEVLG